MQGSKQRCNLSVVGLKLVHCLLRNVNRLLLVLKYETPRLLLLSLAVKWKYVFPVNWLSEVFPVQVDRR